ncbi:hypothetical protein ACS0TY_000576 [Phlomoides rotata]
MLECIPELTLDEKIDVAKIFANNPHYLEMFLGVPVEARARYVYRLLQDMEGFEDASRICDFGII